MPPTIVRSDEECEKLNKEIKEYKDENAKVEKKESTLLAQDIMKLEIKKIRVIVGEEADHVYEQENKKSQLQMSMEEKEIQVHKDVLSSEQKAAEEERHFCQGNYRKELIKLKILKLNMKAL